MACRSLGCLALAAPGGSSPDLIRGSSEAPTPSPLRTRWTTPGSTQVLLPPLRGHQSLSAPGRMMKPTRPVPKTITLHPAGTSALDQVRDI